MKYIFTALAIFVFLGSQGQITEGQVSYDIEVSGAEGDSTAQMAANFLSGSKMKITFSDALTRTDMQMGAFMNMSTLVNEEEDVLMLMNAMGSKTAITGTLDEAKQMNQSSEEDQKAKIETMDDTKKIAGYTCKKAVATSPEGDKTTFWYTDKIEANTEGQQYFDSQIPGFPLQFEAQIQGMTMLVVATEVKEELSKEQKVNLTMQVPEGFTQMTIEEFMQQQAQQPR